MRPDLLDSILSAAERQRAAELRLAAPRRRFVIARAALRILLGRYLQIPPAAVSILANANTKPRLASIHDVSGLHFNVAHSDMLALIAFTTGCGIGADVERVREIRHANHLAKRYFHPAEFATIAAAAMPADRDATFLRYWTGKEALLKAIGTGITGSLSAFQVPDFDDRKTGATIEVATPLHPRPVQCWMRCLDPDNNYIAAMAVVGSGRDVRCMLFQP
jgi:4'-phosphopantetheinyl transferase